MYMHVYICIHTHIFMICIYIYVYTHIYVYVYSECIPDAICPQATFSFKNIRLDSFTRDTTHPYVTQLVHM